MSRGSSAAPSAPRCSRSSWPASWPRKWTRTRPRASSASTSRTSTRSSSPSRDRVRLEGYERSLEQELSGYLLEHARRRSYDLLTRPAVEFKTDERLRLGEFGIQARLVKPPAREGDGADPGRGGPHDGLLGGARSAPEPEAPEPPVATVATRAVVSLDDRRYVLEGPRATIGRSKDAAVRAARPQRLAPPRRAASHLGSGDWTIADLGSTNGIKVNGRRVSSTRLGPGDEVTLGTTTFLFDIEQ